MSKFSKEFWVSDEFINIMNKSVTELPGLTRSSFEYPIEKINTGDRHSAHKITISYEIDREITIKESELRKMLESGLERDNTTSDIIDLVFEGYNK